MYVPQYLEIPNDVYNRSREIATAYPNLTKRREEFSKAEYSEYINEWQIKAIEDAWYSACHDENERKFLSKNIFEKIPMHYIDVPISQSTMKRCRKRFFVRLAENLGFVKSDRQFEKYENTLEKPGDIFECNYDRYQKKEMHT